MTKNAIHNFNLSIKNSADIKSSEHLTEAIIKELAKVSKEMSQQKNIEQVWQEQQSLNTTAIVNNSIISIGEGATNTTAEKSKKQIAVSTTSSVAEGTITNFNVSTGGGTNGTPELFGTTSSVSETETSTLSASIGEGVADTTGRTTMNSPTSANTTSPISGAEDNASNLNGGLTTQTYAGVAAQQTLTVPQMLQTNSGEPTIEAVKAEIKKKLDQAIIANDTETIEYWKGISKAFDEGATVQDFDGQPNNILFTEMYAMLKQSNSVIESQNFNWEIVREKMIGSIDANILNGKISKGSKSRWEIIRKQLNDYSINVANLFEQYDELFLLLKEVEGLDSLPNTITITTKTKIYPNLSADNLYANIGKDAVYVFLKEINNKEVQGSAVNKGAVKIKNTEATSFIVGESLEFFLDENFIKQNVFQKQNINWVVYNSKKKNDKGTIFINEGTSFSYNFDTAGTYKVEAYGNKPGANTKKNVGLSAFVELKIVAQEIVITSSGITKDGLTRASTKEQLFKVTLKNPEIKTLNPLKLYYQVESKTANKITIISEEQELDLTGIVKFTMPNLGEYCIKISRKDQYNLSKEHSINVIKNFVSSIDKVKDNVENDVYLYSKANRNAIFKTKAFKIDPATPQEKENVKWLVYDKKGNLYVPDGLKIQIENSDAEKPYLFKGESFIFPIPKKEDEFTVEAYSNIKQGIKSKSVRKIEVKHPQVIEAFWTYNDGSKKKTSGFAGEINHIKASIPGYINQEVRIKFFLNDSKIANYYNDTKTNSNGEINKILKFDANLQKHFGIKNGKTAKIRFELEGIQNGNEPYLFKQNTNVYNEAILNVTTGVKITDAYFMYDGNRVNPFIQVPYGAKVTGVVKTLNMVGKEVKLKIYKDVHHAKHTAKAIVDGEGVAIINFTLDKKWKEIAPLLGLTDMFYIGMEGVESKISLKNGMNAVVGNIIEAKKANKKGVNNYGIDITYFLTKYKGTNEANLKVLLNDMNEYYTAEKITPQKEHIAYMLATVYTETFKTFKPIMESFWITDKQTREKTYHRYDPVLADTLKRRETAIERGNTKEGDGAKYCGRGYVQLTWKNNYEKIKNQFGIDVVNYPDKTLEPKLAAKIMIWGMSNGIFTGVGINNYINGSKIDYVNARKVINGTDQNKLIAKDAEKFEKDIKIIKSIEAYKPKSLNIALEEMKIIADKHLPYKKEENTGKSEGLRTLLNDAALKKMDCSEFVCRYLHKLGITDEVKWATTASMTSESSFQKVIGTDKIKFVGNAKDFKPQAGDIFVWRNGSDGHTGIVYKYDNTNDLVTILEAIGESGSRDNVTNRRNGGYTLPNCTRTSVYKSSGEALFGHPGFIGYFRPQKL